MGQICATPSPEALHSKAIEEQIKKEWKQKQEEVDIRLLLLGAEIDDRRRRDRPKKFNNPRQEPESLARARFSSR